MADPEIRKTLVSEVLNRSRLEKLLRDSYGNYVIQTILDYCETAQRMVLVECIRPILPSIRNTPYGKRIQSKLAREDASLSYNGGGGGGGGYGGRGGYGRGNFHRHLGRPQLQHINALTEVYGSQGGPFIAPPGGPYGMHAGPGQFGHPSSRDPMAPTHTGLSYHAPGPDGQTWLHLRGPNGGPAPNWNVEGAAGQEQSLPNSVPADGGLDNGMTMWGGAEGYMQPQFHTGPGQMGMM